ncbi:hypothetical protein [Delftia acidovorans]|uniref:hypothetical protein n=1 Tax=Delftia acidovorans TaxID=80866 RepID=UPI003018682D
MPPQQHTEDLIDLEGFAEEDIEAIETIASERGISFDEAVKQLLQEHIKKRREKAKKGVLARLFRFPGANTR